MSVSTFARLLVLVPCVLCAACKCMTCCNTPSSEINVTPVGVQPFTQTVPGCTATLRMVPLDMDDNALNDNSIWMSATEIPWDLYDVFVFQLDKEGEAPTNTPESDAVTRPSKPYIAMDRGFGRNGYPAISMSLLGAQQFCEWLSAKTGKHYRLPTVSEWQAACDDTTQRAPIDARAWHAGNSDRTTHPVGEKLANEHGMYDMLGNAAEWCINDEGKGVVMGGSYRNQPTDLSLMYSQESSPAWNASDPQIPKSKWWLADGGFIGFRVVCDPWN